MHYPHFKNCRRSPAALAMAETEQHSGKAQPSLSPAVSWFRAMFALCCLMAVTLAGDSASLRSDSSFSFMGRTERKMPAGRAFYTHFE